MKSKEKSKEEIVLIRYYNVLFYLVFKGGIDDFNRQCLVNRINTGETVYVVRYHFNEDATETMQEKINRMLVTEASRMAVY